MPLILQADPLPLRMDADGTIRVAHSRITLDVFIEEYRSQPSPAALVQAFDSLTMGEVLAVLAYYENHRNEVEAYLQQREIEAHQLERELEAKGMIWKEAGKTLLARRAQGGPKDQDSSGQ